MRTLITISILGMILFGSLAMASEDYGPAIWDPAYSGNYTVGRGGNAITYVIVHIIQGSYNGCISWFKNPSAKVSAHYVVSRGGNITQMVRNSNTGWHAGNWTYNQRSIGIEHEGYVTDQSFSDAMYRSSAALVRYICNRYGIPTDRAHILGHNEVPGATHTDPGPNWNWSLFMSYVNSRTEAPATSISESEDTTPEYKMRVTGIQWNTEKVQRRIMAQGESMLAGNLFDMDTRISIEDLNKCLPCDMSFPRPWSEYITIQQPEGNPSTASLLYLYDRYEFEVWMRENGGSWQKLGNYNAYAFKGYRFEAR